MPRTMTMMVPGSTMPRNATRAPGTWRSRSPTMMLMLVAFRPGRVWLISRAARKSSSSSQRRFSTSISRRYATTPPPKLVAPMSRNVRKMPPSDTAGAGGDSLTIRHGGTPAAVHDPGLGGVELHPVARGQLQGLEELLRALLGLVVQFLVALELALEGELAGQGRLRAPVAPDGDVGLGAQAMTEMHLADVGQHFLGGEIAHQREGRIGGGPHLLECREERRDIAERSVPQGRRGGQGAVVGVEAPDGAQPVAQGAQLLLELDGVREPARRSHVHRRGDVPLGVAELQHHLALVGRPALSIDGALAQYELAIVQVAGLSVEEEDLANLRLGPLLAKQDDVDLVGRVPHQPGEIAEALGRGEPVGPQDQLVLAVVDLVERMAVGIRVETGG